MLETAESQINKLPSLWQNITTQRDFNTLKFVEILTSSDFPEVEARKWVDDRYPLTIQTMLYAFYSYPITPAFNRWGIYLNYLVHSYMYSYYFLRSMKIKVPGPVAKFVTT
uniref:Very-long-chain 3-oxoacyl-CoA synthase n=1 Tax=Meloidogyne javanica TaxID=6303 RepID=A0A915LWK8_MELJA